MSAGHSESRLLGMDIARRSFGFAVFDRIGTLIDWGTATAHDRTRDREEALLKRLGVLLERYAPTVLVIEDVSAPASRRSASVRRFLSRAAELALAEGVRVRVLRAQAMKRVFARVKATTKHEIATFLAMRYPELAPRLPPKRKLWKSEDERMSIFDAAALVVSYLERGRRPGK